MTTRSAYVIQNNLVTQISGAWHSRHTYNIGTRNIYKIIQNVYIASDPLAELKQDISGHHYEYSKSHKFTYLNIPHPHYVVDGMKYRLQQYQILEIAAQKVGNDIIRPL